METPFILQYRRDLASQSFVVNPELARVHDRRVTPDMNQTQRCLTRVFG